MPKLFRSAPFWLGASLVWLAVLFYLSGKSAADTHLPPFPFSDKVCHFGYFLGGGGLFSAFLFCRKALAPKWVSIGLQVAVVFGLIGIADEYHQTFSPGRSGNDPLDWTADVTGAICGFLIFKRFHQLLKH